MSLILACDVGLNGKTLPRNFFCCFVVRFQEITHAKVRVFLNQPWRQMSASLILLFGKTKALFAKETARKNKCVFAYVISEKRNRNQRTKIGGYVFV